MSNIPCEVIRDLFPSYIEELTSDASNILIKEHLSGCMECRKVLDSMTEKNAGAAPSRTEEDGREIDFLRKNHRRNKWIIFGSIATVIIILAIIFITRYVIGEYRDDPTGDYYMWDLKVDDEHLSLYGWTVNDIFKITGIEFQEENGVLEGKTRYVPSGMIASLIYRKPFYAQYTASEPIRQISINGRIIWNEGDTISMLASCVYQSRHEYIGDMSLNNITARCLCISSYLGPFVNELETKEPPYGWILHLAQEIPSDRLALREADMESFGYVLLAAVENLSRVTFTYQTGGRDVVKTITADEASDFFGQDIKNCYKDVSLMDELIRKTGLDHYVFGNAAAYYSNTISGTSSSPLFINIVNTADEKLRSISMGIYIDGELKESQSGENADNTPIGSGQMLQFIIDGEYLSRLLNENSIMELDFQVETANGFTCTIPGRLRVPVIPGFVHDLHISGNSADGFTVQH